MLSGGALMRCTPRRSPAASLSRRCHCANCCRSWCRKTHAPEPEDCSTQHSSCQLKSRSILRPLVREHAKRALRTRCFYRSVCACGVLLFLLLCVGPSFFIGRLILVKHSNLRRDANISLIAYLTDRADLKQT